MCLPYGYGTCAETLEKGFARVSGYRKKFGELHGFRSWFPGSSTLTFGVCLEAGLSFGADGGMQVLGLYVVC